MFGMRNALLFVCVICDLCYVVVVVWLAFVQTAFMERRGKEERECSTRNRQEPLNERNGGRPTKTKSKAKRTKQRAKTFFCIHLSSLHKKQCIHNI
jgi:hypothetical protein